MKIYVAGPLNAQAPDYIKNLSKMIKVGVKLRNLGHQPYVPGLDLLMGLMDGTWDYEDYTGMNIDFVDCCDAIFIIARSPGVDKEVERAKQLGLKIYTSLTEIPKLR